MTKTRREIAEILLHDALGRGGITLWAGDYTTQPTSGYVVGGISTPRFISAYSAKHQPLTCAIPGIIDWLVTRPGYMGEVVCEGYVGSWKDERGNVHIDQCDILPDLESAIALARHREEIAIYSLHEQKEIRVED